VIPTIKVRSQPTDVQEYQNLLREDWSKNTQDDVLSLLWRLVEESATSSSLAWRNVLEPTTEKFIGKDLNQQIIDHIRGFAKYLPRGVLPGVPACWSDRKATRSLAHAEKTWTYLVLQTLVHLDGATGFFRDAQSLLFLSAVHYLLPQLKSQRLLREHDCLLNAMYMHTMLVWRDQASHLFYLQGLIMDHLGKPKERLALLEQSLRLTPVDDHSYLTKATAYWSDLVELGEYAKARSFLLHLNRNSPESYLDEIGQMLEATLAGANGKKA
jgi:hypothetical protein